ncbi:MAG TPA: helix-turn-helix transcriptional regulator [Defluviitaleaceae bacterium]|nr:helix-turn-helix transcriptional regulator [Candidatus Epulonipiscium sp.]HOQ16761.1 helix-turn-helix transcriptional regulator [Defluviitaleaceae bacterium]HPT75721.1 helix-turn-helix transcriptional regulator [Defluviitaleaceae bacterium]HQD50231.1 helix-turn-helix transcriptional regulator [Defluviitaleaceae bacterium]
MSSYDNAKAMRELRKRRKEKKLCTRCGKPVFGVHVQCDACREYSRIYALLHPKEKVIIRHLKSWEIKNKKLYDILIKKRITIPQLAKMIGVSSRSVDRWVFEGCIPKLENREKVNAYLNMEVFELE